MFYTYAHYRPNGEVFYVGKGTGRRALDKRRNKYWHNVVAKDGEYKVEILSRWHTENEAFDHERLLIQCFRDMGCKLTNLTDGGEGMFGFKLSEETKQKMSNAHANKPKSDAHRQSFSRSMRSRPKEYWDKLKVTLNSDSVKAKWTQARSGAKNAQFLGTIYAVNTSTGESVACVGTKNLREHGFTPSCVYQCLQGLRRTHKGCVFYREPLAT